MKKLLSFFMVILFTDIAVAQNVGIGTTVPNASAILELKDTTRGFLPPRLTIPQRLAISNPQKGLLIWCIDCDELQVFNGTVWKNIANGTAACTTPDFPTIMICSQIWMDKNLDVTTYRNGDPIPKVTDPTAWAALSTGAYCYYNNDSATYAATYGKLYNWYAVNDPRGLAPLGWHIPSEFEWNTLTRCVDPATDTTNPSSIYSFIAGNKLKEAGVSHWAYPNSGATNSSGFTALPGGRRDEEGTFSTLGTHGYWWSSGGTNFFARGRYLNVDSQIALTNWPSSYGLSVRCVKN